MPLSPDTLPYLTIIRSFNGAQLVRSTLVVSDIYVGIAPYMPEDDHLHIPGIGPVPIAHCTAPFPTITPDALSKFRYSYLPILKLRPDDYPEHLRAFTWLRQQPSPEVIDVDGAICLWWDTAYDRMLSFHRWLQHYAPFKVIIPTREDWEEERRFRLQAAV